MTAPGGSEAARRNLTVIQFQTPATCVDSSMVRAMPGARAPPAADDGGKSSTTWKVAGVEGQGGLEQPRKRGCNRGLIQNVSTLFWS